MSELLLIVRIAGERVAISSAQVDAVVEINSTIPVPCAAPHVLGLAALRSRVFTVIDPLVTLGLAPSREGKEFDAVIVRSEGHLYALRVDSIEDSFEFEGEVGQVRTSLSPTWRGKALGTVEADNDLLLLVDVDALLAGPAAMAA
jgi:purine-binding chemotaxis protein CheW